MTVTNMTADAGQAWAQARATADFAMACITSPDLRAVTPTSRWWQAVSQNLSAAAMPGYVPVFLPLDGSRPTWELAAAEEALAERLHAADVADGLVDPDEEPEPWRWGGGLSKRELAELDARVDALLEERRLAELQEVDHAGRFGL